MSYTNPSTPSRGFSDLPRPYFTPSLSSINDTGTYASMSSPTATTFQQQNETKSGMLGTPLADMRTGVQDLMISELHSTDIEANRRRQFMPSSNMMDHTPTPMYQMGTASMQGGGGAARFGSKLSFGNQLRTPASEQREQHDKPAVVAAAAEDQLSKCYATIERLNHELSQKDALVHQLSSQNEALVTAMALGKHTNEADEQELAHRMLTRLRFLKEENERLSENASAKRVICLEAMVENLKADYQALQRSSRAK